MAIDSDYVKQMATQLASYEVQSSLDRLNRNEANYQAQRTALTTLRSSLTTFKSTVSGLNSRTDGMLTNKATFSQDGYVSATVSTKAEPGTYQFFVEQLASRQQTAIKGLTAENLSGNLTLTPAGASPQIINLADYTSLEEVAAAINAADSGVQANLVRSQGEVSLVLTSEKSGEEHAFAVDLSGHPSASTVSLSEARDAKLRLGGEFGVNGSGILLSSSTNTFENVIDGVSLTVNKTHSANDAALTLEVGQDQSATKTKVQNLVNAYNTLMSSFDSLTVSGDDNTQRGALAGDGSIRSIESRLNTLLRTSFGGNSLINFGISATRNGQLSIDTARFEAALAADPEGFEALFTGKDGLLDSIDKALTPYTSSTNGLLKNRIDTLDQSLRRMDEEFDKIQSQYDNFYNRYLKQYTTMMQTMQSMEQTFGMFG